ncbi:MAG: amidohydrolase [Planctomycetota bacterium]
MTSSMPLRAPWLSCLLTGASTLLTLASNLMAQSGGTTESAAIPVADLILRGGRVVTVDAQGTEGEAIAIDGGKVLRVGSNEEVNEFRGEKTRIVELEGRLAIPGFVEGHAHFFGVGDSAMQLDLRRAKSWGDIVDQVAAAVASGDLPKGTLIRGRGWHQEKWTREPKGAIEGLPHHRTLSAVSPDHPVVLTHASGHATFANGAAMQLCGIDASTPDPEGGEIVRGEDGEPIGAFRETASGLLGPAYIKARQPDPRRQARLAVGECLRKGVTSFQDLGGSFEEVEVLKQLADAGDLDVRLWVVLREPAKELAELLPKIKVTRYGDNHLTVGGIKRSIDGALGSHGAWLLEPYADLKSSAGLNTATIEDVFACAEVALENDVQLCVHAIGDRANREVLDIYAQVFGDRPERRALRWRIEHAQHLHPDDVRRFAKLGVIAAMQGIHCTSDAPWVLRRLGDDRAESGAYLWRSLLDAGAVVTNGTDAPVEDLDPIASFYATVTRKLSDGSAFYPEQAMTRMEALRSYTLSGAYSAFEEDIKGSLEPGKLADVVVLSRDILSCDEDEILGTRVDMTVVGGEVLFER